MKTYPIVNGARAPRKPHRSFPRALNQTSGRGGRCVAKAITPRPTEAFRAVGALGSPQEHTGEAIRTDLERPSLEALKDGTAVAAVQGDGWSIESRPVKGQATKRARGSFKTMSAYRSSPEWQQDCWARWPKEESWPGVLDLYEAAARVRMSPDTLRRAAATGRDGRAKLAHQRFGTSYRFRTRDIDSYGLVHGR